MHSRAVGSRSLLALLATLVLGTGAAYGDTIVSDNFNDNSLNSSLWTVFVQGNGSVSEINSRLRLSLVGASGTDTIAGVFFRGTIVGDFDIQISFGMLSSLPAGSGGDPPSVGIFMPQFSDVAYIAYGGYSGGSAYGADVGTGEPSVSTSDTSGRLRLARVGSIWSAYYWGQTGWQLVAADNTRGTGPITSLALAGVISDPVNVAFAVDDFSVQAGQVTMPAPEPGSWLLLGMGVVGLGARRRLKKRT